MSIWRRQSTDDSSCLKCFCLFVLPSDFKNTPKGLDNEMWEHKHLEFHVAKAFSQAQEYSCLS